MGMDKEARDLAKEAQFVTHVLRQTQSKELSWSRRDPPPALFAGTNSRVFDFFTAQLQNKILGIFEIRDRHYDGDRDEFFWGSDVRLALFDQQMNHEYTLRVGATVLDLFAEVKRQVSSVDEFIDAIMSGPKKS